MIQLLVNNVLTCEMYSHHNVCQAVHVEWGNCWSTLEVHFQFLRQIYNEQQVQFVWCE